MRAAFVCRYGGDEVVKIGAVPDPEVGANDVLIEVKAASVNPLDFKIRQGKTRAPLPYRFPLMLGNDCAGVVTRVGAAVRRFEVPDEVFARLGKDRIGAFAEFAFADESIVALKPASASFAEAASPPLVGLTSWQALVDIAKISRGQTALIRAGRVAAGYASSTCSCARTAGSSRRAQRWARASSRDKKAWSSPQQRVMEVPHRYDRVTAGEVAATPWFDVLVERVAGETGKDVADVRTRALECLAELETGHSRWFRQLAVKAGRALCRLGYDRIDYDPGQLARVQELFQTNSVVVLSSHRSYLDGAALTVAFEDNGLPPPFEFVGINMAFWPLGSMWRRMGGILLRRQATDPVYRAALRGFLAHLVATRRPVRWFVEGTRSRTGKLAPPKLGLLAYVIDGYLAGDSTDLKLLPVSVSYDQLQEVEEFSVEARGGRKDAESMGWLVRYLRAQRGRFGTIHVRFGEPIPVGDSLGPPGIPLAGGGEAQHLAVQKLALEVCWRINTATPITDIALVGIALLAARGRALSVPQIRLAVRGYRESAMARGLPLVAPHRDEEEALQQSLEALQSREVVARIAVNDVECFGVAPGRHLALGYYRNTLVHFFLEDAIAELALLAAIEASPETREGTFHAAALELRELLKFDFFFRDKVEFSASVEARMRRLDARWTRRLPEGLHGAIHLLEHADILCSDMMLRPFVEAHALVADTLLDAAPATLHDEAGFVTACEARGGTYLRDRRLRHPESISRVLFRTGIQSARERRTWEDGPECVRRRADLAATLWSIVRRMDIVHGIAVRRLELLVSGER